jgi:hypothetical protein
MCLSLLVRLKRGCMGGRRSIQSIKQMVDESYGSGFGGRGTRMTSGKIQGATLCDDPLSTDQICLSQLLLTPWLFRFS